MLTDFSPIIIIVFAFGAVAIAVFVIAQYIAVQMRVQQRVASSARESNPQLSLTSSVDQFVAAYFDEKRFGFDGTMRAKLRRELIRAGFFNPSAINYYIFARL